MPLRHEDPELWNEVETGRLRREPTLATLLVVCVAIPRLLTSVALTTEPRWALGIAPDPSLELVLNIRGQSLEALEPGAVEHYLLHLVEWVAVSLEPFRGEDSRFGCPVEHSICNRLRERIRLYDPSD
jgi:hypothetical protein